MESQSLKVLRTITGIQILWTIITFAIVLFSDDYVSNGAPAFFVFPIEFILFHPALWLIDCILLVIIVLNFKNIQLQYLLGLVLWTALPFILSEDFREGWLIFLK